MNYFRTHCLYLGVTVKVTVMVIVEVRVGVKLRVDARVGIILSSLTP